MRRRQDNIDDEGALSRQSTGAWKLLGLIGSILTAAGLFIAFDARQARAAAKDVVEARVGPVEKRLDDHLSSSRALREVMDRYVQEQRDTNHVMRQKLDALCRANPRADCPLGE
jgi:hypothetical protein